MKKLCVLTISGVVFLLMPVFATAQLQTVSGTIQGLNAHLRGYHSVERIDPHVADLLAATESFYIIMLEGEGMRHYVIKNVDRAVLSRLINQKIRMDGIVQAAAGTIDARNIYAIGRDKSMRKIWSFDPNDDIYRDLFGAKPLGGN